MRRLLRIFALVHLVGTAGAFAACPLDALYQQSTPWTGIATDNRFIYVSQPISSSVVIRRIDATDGTTTDLATINDSAAKVVAAVNGYVLFTTLSDRGINALGPDGVQQLAASLDSNARFFRSDGVYVYWFDAGDIFRVPLTGGDVQAFAIAVPSVRDLALHDDDVYFIAADGLFRVPKIGGVPALVASDADLESIADINENTIVATAVVPHGGIPPDDIVRGDRVELRAIPTGGGASDVLASLPLRSAVFDTHAVVRGQQILLSIRGTQPRSLLADGELLLVTGNVVVPLARDLWTARALQTDDAFVAEIGDYPPDQQPRIVRLCDPPPRRRVAY